MKLIISKTALEMAVKNICRVINTKNALPILGDVKASSQTDLSYPDKRDCGVSQRAKKNDFH